MFIFRHSQIEAESKSNGSCNSRLRLHYEFDESGTDISRMSLMVVVEICYQQIPGLFQVFLTEVYRQAYVYS